MRIKVIHLVILVTILPFIRSEDLNKQDNNATKMDTKTPNDATIVDNKVAILIESDKIEPQLVRPKYPYPEMDEFRPHQPACPGRNQYYDKCGSNCIPTCSDPTGAKDKNCDDKCFSGCFCRKNHVLFGSECIPLSECPNQKPTCGDNQRWLSCGPRKDCEESCELTHLDSRCRYDTGCLPGCYCEKGFVKNQFERCVPRKDCRDDGSEHHPGFCSRFGKETIWCNGGDEKCIRTCKNKIIDYRFLCKPGDWKCVPYCDCPRGKVWDEESQKCISVDRCDATCPRHLRVLCRSNNVRDCLKTCDNKNFQLKKQHVCDDPRDPGCRLYCDCGPGRYLNPITKVCVDCDEDKNGCKGTGKAFVNCNRRNPNDCKFCCNKPFLSKDYECDPSQTIGLCHKHCQCANGYVEHKGSCIPKDKCTDANQQCKVKVTCAIKNCDNTCRSGKSINKIISESKTICRNKPHLCKEEYLCPKGTLLHSVLNTCVPEEECPSTINNKCARGCLRTQLIGCIGTASDCRRTCESRLDQTKCCILSGKNPECNPICVCPNNEIWDDEQFTCVPDKSHCSKGNNPFAPIVPDRLIG